MGRFQTVVQRGRYSIQEDTYNGYFCVFVRCDGFSQQIGNPYYRLGNALRKLDKILGK